jgi:hypothetical protein
MPKAMRCHVLAPLNLRAVPVCALLCLAATAQAAESPSLPALKPAAIEVDITALPASEQAALVPLIRAARQMDALYVRQVWPGTRALIAQRQADRLRTQGRSVARQDHKGRKSREAVKQEPP